VSAAGRPERDVEEPGRGPVDPGPGPASTPAPDVVPSAGGPRPGMARSMTISFVGNLFPPLAALISGPILAQALGVEGRGEVAAATAPLGLAVTLVTFGVPEAVTFAVARHPGAVRVAAKNGYRILVVAGLLAMAAVYFSRTWLSGGDPGIGSLMAVACLATVPNLLVGVLRGIASGLQQWSLVATERVLASGLRLAALIPLWLMDELTPFTATVLLAAMPLAGALAYLRLPRRLPPADPVPEEAASTRRLVSFGLRVWAGSVSGVLLSRVDQTLMTPLSSAHQLGLYVVAVSLSELPLIINSAVRDVTFVTDAHRSVDSRLAASARISSVLCAVAAIGLGTTMVWWLPLLFGEGFRDAVPVAAVLLLAVVLGTPGSIGGAGLSGRGRPGLRSISLAVACVGNIVLLVLLVPTWGAMGAAWATLAGTVTASTLNLVFLRRLFGIPMRWFYGLRRSDVEILRDVGRRAVHSLPAPFGRRARR
jgi:O-antigen/teichoic acid export membrane protein